MTKEDLKDFENCTKCSIRDNVRDLNTDVKVRDHCHITGKYRGPIHRGWCINVELNHKFLSYFTT